MWLYANCWAFLDDPEPCQCGSIICAMAKKARPADVSTLGVITVRQGQSNFAGKERETWNETLKCSQCDAVYLLGPNRHYAYRGKKEGFYEELKEILVMEHKANHPHQDAYDLGG